MVHERISEPLEVLGTRARRVLDRWWWAPLVGGALWFVIAWMVFRANVTSLATVGVLVGVVLLVASAAETLLAALVPGGWKVLHVVLAALFLISAVWSFVLPVATFFALASMLGLLLFLQGALYIVRAVGMRDRSRYWGFMLASGILIVALAIWVSTSDRVWTLGAKGVFVLVWVGLMAIFRGVSDIVLSFELRRMSKGTENLDGESAMRLDGPFRRDDSSVGRRDHEDEGSHHGRAA